MRTVGAVRPEIEHFIAVLRFEEFPVNDEKVSLLHFTDDTDSVEIVIVRFRLVSKFVNGVAILIHGVAVIGNIDIAASTVLVVHHRLDGLLHVAGDGAAAKDHRAVAADIQPFDDTGTVSTVDLQGAALQIDGLCKGIVPVFIEFQRQRGARFHGHFGNLKSLIDIGIDHVCAVFHHHQLGNAQGLCHNVFQIQRVTFQVEGTVIFAVMSRVEILFAVRPVLVHPF